jgi:hypothetical protein
LEAFLEKLNNLALTLSKDERLILAALIFVKMDPLERMRWKKIEKILKPNELEILKSIEKQLTK